MASGAPTNVNIQSHSDHLPYYLKVVAFPEAVQLSIVTMDSFQACQFLQKFIGKSSSSATELFELFSALMPLSDILTNPKAPEKVLATAASESVSMLDGRLSQFTAAFPVQVSREALESIFDISFIAIDVKISICHRYWIERLKSMYLGKTLASFLGAKGSPNSFPSMIVKLSFRFAENFDIECYEVSVIDGEDASTTGLQSIMTYLPVKPFFSLDWGIHKYDPRPARTDPLGFIESQIPRFLRVVKIALKRAIRVQRSKDRAALLYTPRILNHVRTKISALESRSEFYSEDQNHQVKQLRSKLDMFYASPAFRVQAAVDNIVGMVNPRQAINFSQSIGSVVYPDQAINLTGDIRSMGKFHLTSKAGQSLEKSLSLAGDKLGSGREVFHGENQSMESPKEQTGTQTRVTMLNFKLPDILQAMLLAAVTEVYCVLLKFPTSFNAVFDRLFTVLLNQIKPDHAQNANFRLVGTNRLPDMPCLPLLSNDEALDLDLSSRVNLPRIPDSLGSILKPALPHKNTLSGGSSSLPSARLPSLMASKAVSPMILRSVSWGANSSDSECDTREVELKDSTAESKNRKLLPKSPKPKAQFSMSMKNTAVSKPPLEPIKLISESFKDHSLPLKIGEGNKSPSRTNDSDKEN